MGSNERMGKPPGPYGVLPGLPGGALDGGLSVWSPVSGGGSLLPPILRQRRSLKADTREIFGVRSFFAINAQVHNSLHSDYHQEVKLGFRCQSLRKNRRQRLRPLPPGAQQVRLMSDIEPLKIKRKKPLPGLGEAPSPPGARSDQKEKGGSAGPNAVTAKSKDGKTALGRGENSSGTGQIRTGGGSYDKVVKDVRHTSNDLHELKTKAREGLLGAKRNGDLERLASEMEQKLLEKAEQVGAIGDRARKQLEQQEQATQEAKAVAEDLQAIKTKARKNLLQAKRDGNLERVAADMEAELNRKVEELNAIKAKARGSLLNARRSGELNQIADQMEEAQREIEQQAATMRDIKEKARRNLINAKKTGELEELAAGMEKILNDDGDAEKKLAASMDMAAVKTKAREGLLNAKRSGQLEAIADEMEGTAKAIEEKKKEIQAIRRKAKTGLLAAKQSGDLERLASEYEEEMGRKAQELHELKQQARDSFGADSEDTRKAIAQMDAAERGLKAQAKEFQEIKEKARRGLIDAKRTGELEKIAGQMDRVMAEGEQNMEEATRRAAEVKSRAKKGLLEAKRNGELQALADEMDLAQQELQAKAAAFRDVKEKAKKGLLDANRKGELEALARSMEQTVRRIDEAQAKMERLQETKAKASKGLLKAKRDGSLEQIAAGM